MGSDLVGLVVLYALTGEDATKINRRRTTGKSIAERMTKLAWPEGAQAHIGNTARAGDLLPMIVTAVQEASTPDGDRTVNGQVFLDGNDTLWVTSAPERMGTGGWQRR